MKRVTTQEDFDKYPDGTIFRLLHTGQGWEEDEGKIVKVIKKGDKLRIYVDQGFYYFSDRNDQSNAVDDYSFEIYKADKDEL